MNGEAEVTVQYAVTWEYLRSDLWLTNAKEFTNRPEAEEYYDSIVRLEKLFGTPRDARLRRRSITVTAWEQVER